MSDCRNEIARLIAHRDWFHEALHKTGICPDADCHSWSPSQQEVLDLPVLDEEIDKLYVVVKGLAFANVADIEHVRALQRLARLAIRSDQ